MTKQKREIEEGKLREQKARRSRRRRNQIQAMIVVLSLLAVVTALVFFGMALLKYEKSNTASPKQDAAEAMGNTVVYSQEELDGQIAAAVEAAEAKEAADIEAARKETSTALLNSIRSGLTDGQTVLETLRPLYPEELIVASSGKYHFVPINRNLRQSSLVQENVTVLETGEIQYVSDGQVISHKGIDVSKHQGDIDWQQVAQDGVEFAFVRVALRGYGTGKLVEDEYFEQNVEGAQAAGIKVGVYLYSQAVTEEEVLEEANLVLEKAAPYTLECPIVFDVEKVSGAKGRMNTLSVEERTRLTLLFCQTIEAAGYRPMIYHNMEMGVLLIDLEQLEDYDKWFASYSEKLYYPYDYQVWQYSQNGTVAGINGAVDMNLCVEPIWE